MDFKCLVSLLLLLHSCQIFLRTLLQHLFILFVGTAQPCCYFQPLDEAVCIWTTAAPGSLLLFGHWFNQVVLKVSYDPLLSWSPPECSSCFHNAETRQTESAPRSSGLLGRLPSPSSLHAKPSDGSCCCVARPLRTRRHNCVVLNSGDCCDTVYRLLTDHLSDCLLIFCNNLPVTKTHNGCWQHEHLHWATLTVTSWPSPVREGRVSMIADMQPHAF